MTLYDCRLKGANTYINASSLVTADQFFGILIEEQWMGRPYTTLPHPIES